MATLRQPPAIEGFGGGGFRIEGVRFEGSVLILEDVARPWPVAALADLTRADIADVLAAGRERVEFLLLGAGPETFPPPRAIRQALFDAGLGLEVMSTIEACRTYNMLAKDGRRVAAALIAV